MTYYAPTLFQTSLGMNQEMALLLGCFTQLWYVIASFLTVSHPFFFLPPKCILGNDLNNPSGG